jgi:UDP-N-acetylglucosamine diphosphorylase / glucose-1-phosphate thymidylyltransferase / UDP-N-acetylgalactosamine diphosphorylase / glucosamine-1-phosphate N-acetyltransferase / galactosamine-1-phosphate N-acetyltransferase
MRLIIITETSFISPFNEPARDLRVQNKPLWLWQRDLLAAYAISEEREYPNLDFAKRFEHEKTETFVHCDNIFFNRTLIDEFIDRGRKGGKAVRLAFSNNDPAIATHVKPLSHSFVEQSELLLANMWYLPDGIDQIDDSIPLVIDTESRERGYYHVPPYMATEFGDLVYQLPRKVFVIVESWVHIFVTDILFGVFARGADVEDQINREWWYKLKILFRSVMEQKKVLANSEVVHIGKNANIDPTAVIHGLTVIGDNVTIGAGAVIDNCIIGNNVTISQGCHLLLSVVGDGCFLPFRASLFMTSLMENTSVAQNSCLQLCVIGRDSFIGAGNTFTDFNILGGSLRTFTNDGDLEDTNLLILGGCVGHHCRISSGSVVYAARTIESDVVLIATDERHFITKNIRYEDSDHHSYANKYPYSRQYPRKDGT